MTNPLTLFHHLYENNSADRVLVLLHGTGGDEHDLLPVGRRVSHRYNLLSLRGNVQEQGMNRFFARLELGVFDQDSIRQESAKLATFLKAWCIENQYQLDQLVFLGFSNGANMILAMLFLFPEVITQAVVLHPMLPFEPPNIDLSDKRLLVTYGIQDPMVPLAQSIHLLKVLKQLNVTVESLELPGGHGVTNQELTDVLEFLEKLQ
jgi:phospholipase/carboxylesterase